nr:developmentally-regulated G-protein 2 [Tanacetum cinerariifolium]GFA73300.1 developmentally-regulated G-protein 2 [Tanacetum cinerariifolium]
MLEGMGLVRVYTKPQGQQPDFSDPVVLSADRGGCSVEDFCNQIHISLVQEAKYVLVWGSSARHSPQHCGPSHVLQDEDVVQIVKKKCEKSNFCQNYSSVLLYNALELWLYFHETVQDWSMPVNDKSRQENEPGLWLRNLLNLQPKKHH